NFTRVQRRRLFQKYRTSDSIRAASGLCCKRVQQILKMLPHPPMVQDFGYRRKDQEVRAKRTASLDIRKNHHAHIVAVMTGDDHVTRKWRKKIQNPCSQRSDAHPSPGRQLEVLGETAVEHETFIHISRIDKPNRGPKFGKAIFVERFLRKFRLAPVTQRDI